ncbi:ankyrin repeat protein [Dictyocaulus viviparus]|uniref:phospholipase A2 n=1 Tax=Dictyocaulus viviparus TaxID=29172 RepID=A0A0D8XYS6_DICVI|nr:ankyrin repeat protein [Dictyocaulus viviparus]
MFKSILEFVSNTNTESIISAARTVVSEFNNRSERQHQQKVEKLTQSRYSKMLKLDNLKNVSCHSESVGGTTVFHIVYMADLQSLMQEKDEKLVRILCSKLDSLLSTVDERSLRNGGLYNLMDFVSREPTWEATHYAAACGFNSFLKAALEKDPHLVLGFATCEGEFAVHIAAKSNQLETVRLLLEYGADLCQKDAMGRNVIHWAAANSSSTLKELSNEASFIKAIGIQDEYGLVPLALAIHKANFESVKILMGSANTFPPANAPPLLNVLCGMKYSEGLANCLALVITITPSIVEQVDRNGRCVLHLQLDKKVLLEVLKHSFGNIDVNLKDVDGQTPLHLAVNRGDVGGAVALLCYGADVNVKDKQNRSALIRAIQVEHLDVIKLLLLFDADLNSVDEQGQSVHDIVKTSKRKMEIDALITQMTPPLLSSPTPKKIYFDDLTDILALLDYQQNETVSTQKCVEIPSGEIVNVLSLDGGGIRGLVLIQVLCELEKRLGSNLITKFHWLGGTSTGAILALALSQGKTIADCRSIFLRYKDDIFYGMRPYSGTNMESFLQSEFGKKTTLADITSKKVMVITCIANVCPPKMEVFRNYQLHLSAADNENMGFRSPENTHVYVAARCSSAAPTYFPPFENKYMDGGLIANNPCLQLISDIQLVNSSLRMACEIDKCYRIGCILSVGTGRTAERSLESFDPNIPKSFAELGNSMIAAIDFMKNLLLDQIAKADGKVVDYARAWSHSISVPFFRFSPMLSDPIDLDETDDVKLINMMWHTKVYMNEENYSVTQLIDVLKHFEK